VTPEKDIERVIASVHAASGHWPYTRDADLYIGFRPAGEALTLASDRVVRTRVSYDIVIAAKRGDMAGRMEALRYKLYAALLRAGWMIDGTPGPETYVAAHGLFLWPVTATKGFAMSAQGVPMIIGGE